MRKLMLAFLAISMFVAGVATTSAQDTEPPLDQEPVEPNYYWSLNMSSPIIFIGETLWCNVSGFPHKQFSVKFTNATNSSFEQYGFTDDNGTASVIFSGLDTGKVGHYAVSLLLNGTVYASANLDINWDPYYYLILENDKLKAELDELERTQNRLSDFLADGLAMFRRGYQVIIFFVCLWFFEWMSKKLYPEGLATAFKDYKIVAMSGMIIQQDPQPDYIEFGGVRPEDPAWPADVPANDDKYPADQKLAEKTTAQILKESRDRIEYYDLKKPGDGVVKPPSIMDKLKAKWNKAKKPKPKKVGPDKKVKP